MLVSAHTGAGSTTSVTATERLTDTMLPFGRPIVEGLAVTPEMTGAVVSAGTDPTFVRRKTEGTPLKVPSPTIVPAAFTARAAVRTQPAPLFISEFRSLVPSAAVWTNALVPLPRL